MSYDHKTQVGGHHYNQGDKPQHWDLVLIYNWDYFQGQIVKYVMRWKDKHETPELRLQDLKKARSFLDKYILEEENKLIRQKEIYAAGSAIMGHRIIGADSLPHAAHLVPIAPTPLIDSNEHWSNEGYYGDGTQLYKCRQCKSTKRTSVTPPPHGCGVAKAVPKAREAGGQPREPYKTEAGRGGSTIFQTGSGNS